MVVLLWMWFSGVFIVHSVTAGIFLVVLFGM